LPKKETIIIVQSFREVLFAFQKGFNFIYMGLLQYQMIRAFIENDHKVIKYLTRKVTKIISHSIGSPLLIYFTDVHPAEILFRIVTEAKEKKFTTVCGQHGVFLNVNKPDFVYEGKYSDYFLATGNSQEKVAPNKIGNKVKVSNGSKIISGYAVALDSVGNLIVQTKQETVTVTSGDVTLI